MGCASGACWKRIKKLVKSVRVVLDGSGDRNNISQVRVWHDSGGYEAYCDKNDTVVDTKMRRMG
jgi:hypothetical protein